MWLSLVTLGKCWDSASDIKGKAVPLQVWSDPEGSRKLRFPVYMTAARDDVKVQPYALAAFTPRKCSWYSFLLRG
jgi:hypothetical protein